MSAYRDALDFRGGRAEIKRSFARERVKYTVFIGYQDTAAGAQGLGKP